MPATQVSPALRRRISDDARMLLRAALSEGCGDLDDDDQLEVHTGARVRSANHLPPTQRLQNFRGQLRLELLQPGETEAETAVPLRITATSSAYLLRYQVASTGAEVSVLNRAGVATSWITTVDGQHIQLGQFLAGLSTIEGRQEARLREMETSKAEIMALLGILDSLDLLDMVRALGGTSSGIYFGAERVYHAAGEGNTYVFTFDARTGYPLAITQAATDPGANDAHAALQLLIDDYVRHDDSSIEAPLGIKSDVALLVGSSVACFYEWSAAGRQQMEQLFALLDRDDDGSVSGQDVVEQLLEAGHSSERAEGIAMEMTRLLCDSENPSEEVRFLPFVGFWVMLLADDVRVSDPSNELRVLPALQQLFLLGA